MKNGNQFTAVPCNAARLLRLCNMKACVERMTTGQRRYAWLTLAVSLCLVTFNQSHWMPHIETTEKSKRTVLLRPRHDDNEDMTTAKNFAASTETLSLSSLFIDLEGQIPFPHRPNLPPVEMLQTYISQHSEESLVKDWKANNTEHRRFAIVHYSCPQQLGNRLHHFYNDFLFAFLTNRTLLWKFWDRDACIQLGNQYDHNICIDQNRTLSIDDPAMACRDILHTAPWMPRFDEWNERLDLPGSVQVWIRPINAHNAPHPPPKGVERIPWSNQKGLDSSGVTTDIGVSTQWKIVVFQPMVGVLNVGFVKKQLTQNEKALARVEALFAYGPEFWYGALFDHAFRFQDNFLKSIQPSLQLLPKDTDPSSLSIALHSRHTDPSDDGSNVTEEVNCLQLPMRSMKALNKTSCQIFMMSDRPQTLAAIENWLESQAIGCTVIQAQHDTQAKEAGLETEHGPFAGAGFVQDLELASREASQSLHAVWIGHKRSSSKLLLEWLTYRRAIWCWKDFGLEPSRLPELLTCELPG